MPFNTAFPESGSTLRAMRVLDWYERGR